MSRQKLAVSAATDGTTPAPRRPAPTRAAKPASAARRKTRPANSLAFNELAALGEENLAACVACGTIVAKGFGSLREEVLSFAQASLDANLTAADRMLRAESVRDLIAAQTDLTQNGVARWSDEATKISTLLTQLATEAMDPIRDRLTANAASLVWPFGR